MTDARTRCEWVNGADPLMVEYHDREWGLPVHEDRKHFEFLVLEAAQAGLSWSTVLRKREGYRRAFADFDPEKVARFTDGSIEKLVLDPAIIRNRMKIEAAVKNARHFLAVQDEFGSFDAYAWRFVDGRPQAESAKGNERRSGDVAAVRRLQQGPQGAADSPLSARPSSMPTCRRSEWSTIIWSAASAIARFSAPTSLAARLPPSLSRRPRTRSSAG